MLLNATIDRIECERNVCENELHRLRYGLENLLKNSIDQNNEFTYHYGYDYAFRSPLSYTDQMERSNISDFRTIKTTIDSTYKSLLYKILETKLLDCLHTNQKIDMTPSDSISIISTTETIPSLDSNSISAFPPETPTSHIDPTVLKLNPEKNTLKVNDYRKSRLTVPKSKTLGSKKSKKRNVSNKKRKSK